MNRVIDMNWKRRSTSGTVDALIIGAGHSGMAMSHCLTRRSVDHVILERGSVGNSWRTERWDSLRLLTPNWQARLPGYSYHTEGLHGLRDSYIASLNATMYPQVTAMAATANATLIHEMAHVMGIEARAVHNVYMDYLFSGGRGGNCTPSIGKCTGNNTEIGTRGGFLSIYGPTMNIIRDPRWGRAQESISGMDPQKSLICR